MNKVQKKIAKAKAQWNIHSSDVDEYEQCHSVRLIELQTVQMSLTPVKRSEFLFWRHSSSSSNGFSRSSDDVRKESKGLAMVHTIFENDMHSKLGHICSSRAPNGSSMYALA